MKPLISSGDAKITAARSPIMPGAQDRGCALRWTVLARVGLEAEIALPEIAHLAVGRRSISPAP
jgi:hypothetical protein